MKKMTKWVAVFAACLMCSVPATAAEGVQASEITQLSSAAVMQEAEYSDAIPVASEGETQHIRERLCHHIRCCSHEISAKTLYTIVEHPSAYAVIPPLSDHVSAEDARTM